MIILWKNYWNKCLKSGNLLNRKSIYFTVVFQDINKQTMKKIFKSNCWFANAGASPGDI